MRLFRFLLPLVLYFIVVSGHTTEISINEAKEIATNFLIERYNPNLNDFAKKDHLSEVFVKSFDDRNIYYTINYSSGGWVVISATDLVIPILAYSYIGKYNPDNEPDNFRAWMFQYSRQIIEAIEQNKIPDDYIKNKWKYYLSDDYHNLLDYKQGRSV